MKARRNSRTSRRNRRRGAKTRGKCATGKLRFQSRLEAMIALVDTGKEGASSRRSEKRFYRCPQCFGWHLTSQQKN